MTDETAELQALIDSSESLTLDRDWTCNGTITITRPIVLDFAGHTLRAITDLSETLDGTSTTRLARRARAHLRIQSAGGVTVLRPHIIGAHPNGGMTEDAYDPNAEAQHGIDILDSENVLIRDAVVSDVWGDFVYVGKASDGVEVNGLHGRRNGRQGIAVSSGANITFAKLDLDQVRRTMIDLEPNRGSETVERVLVEDSTFGEARLNFLSCSSAAGHIGDITLDNLSVVMPFRSTIGNAAVLDRGPFFLRRIRAVKWHGSPLGACVAVTNTDGLIVDDCFIPTQPGRNMHLIRTRGDCSNIIVAHTELPNAVGIAHPESERRVVGFSNSVGYEPTTYPAP